MSKPILCPGCGRETWKFCWDCNDYVDKLGSTRQEKPKKKTTVKDDRKEDEIRMATRRALELHGWAVLDFEQGYRKDGSTRVRKGLPDLAAMGQGHFAWIELKSATGRQTKEQKDFQALCGDCGIPYHLWRHEKEAIEWAETMKVKLGPRSA